MVKLQALIASAFFFGAANAEILVTSTSSQPSCPAPAPSPSPPLPNNVVNGNNNAVGETTTPSMGHRTLFLATKTE